MREYGDPSPGTLASGRAGCPFLPGENGGLGNQHPVRRAATRAIGDPVFSGAKECGGAAGTPKWGHHRPEPRGKEESGSGQGPGGGGENPAAGGGGREGPVASAISQEGLPRHGGDGVRAGASPGREIIAPVSPRPLQPARREGAQGPPDQPGRRPRTPGSSSLGCPGFCAWRPKSRLKKKKSTFSSNCSFGFLRFPE